jgi:hypothetical protein
MFPTVAEYTVVWRKAAFFTVDSINIYIDTIGAGQITPGISSRVIV